MSEQQNDEYAQSLASALAMQRALRQVEDCATEGSSTEAWSAFESPEAFRASGLLKRVNGLLRPYGWGIAYVMGENGEVSTIQPLTIPVPTATELEALSEEDQGHVSRLERLTVPD